MVEASWQWSSRFWNLGSTQISTSQITMPEPGGPRRRTKCWPGKATFGGCHEPALFSAQPEQILQERSARCGPSLGREEKHPGAHPRVACMRHDADCDDRRFRYWLAHRNYYGTNARTSRPRHRGEVPFRGTQLGGASVCAVLEAVRQGQQICCEQIEVAASPDRLADVAPTLLGIIVPDLPVVVWSRGHSLVATISLKL